MKLISWNVQSKEKVSDHVLALSSREPQVVALQEVTPNAAPRFEEWFNGLAFPMWRIHFKTTLRRMVL